MPRVALSREQKRDYKLQDFKKMGKYADGGN